MVKEKHEEEKRFLHEKLEEKDEQHQHELQQVRLV